MLSSGIRYGARSAPRSAPCSEGQSSTLHCRIQTVVVSKFDARGGLPRRVAGELERHGGGSGRRGHLCSFTPPAPTGSRLATRARPYLGRRLGLPMYGGPVPLTNTVRRRGGLNAPPACHSPCPLCQVSPILGSLTAHRAVAHHSKKCRPCQPAPGRGEDSAPSSS